MEYKFRIFSGLRMNHHVLEGCSFYDCNFDKCHFEDIELRECEFENCTFSSCAIRNVKHAQLKIIDCMANNTLLQGINFGGIAFPHAFSFSGCKLSYVDFISLDLQKGKFTTNLFKACFFEECNLKKSDFSGCEFDATEFRQTDLSGCDFSDTSGLDINHLINRLANTKIPEEAGYKILQRMGLIIT